MSFATFHKLSSYALITSGVLAVAVTGTISPLPALFLIAILAASWFLDTARIYHSLSSWARVLIPAVCLPAVYLEYHFWSLPLAECMLHILLFLAAWKLLTRTTDGDHAILYLYSFGSLLVTAALTAEFTYLLFLIPWLVAAAGSLILQEMRRSSTAALKSGKLRAAVAPRLLQDKGFELFSGFPARAMTSTSLILAFSTLLVAAPLFLLLPRIPLETRHTPPIRPGIVSGFSENVELGSLGTILESDAPVMRVKIDPMPPDPPPDLKWRGIALDHYDGRSWSRSLPELFPIPTQAGYFKLHETALGAEILIQTIFLQPLSTRVIFGSHTILAVSGDFGLIERDRADNIYTLTSRPGTTRYTVVSEINHPDPELIASYAGAFPPQVESCCLQLPPEDPRIAALARSVTAQAAAPYQKAQILESYLRSSYRYSLELTGTPDHPDPLAMFLFEVRRGHCEYFATAMAVMLRQLGIPSRMVNGFRAGEFNRFTRHWTVRQHDAHSWVEAYFAPYGWIEFDPTPSGPDSHSASLLHALAEISDAADFWWAEHVISFDMRKQSAMLQLGRDGILRILDRAGDYGRGIRDAAKDQVIPLMARPETAAVAGLLALGWIVISFGVRYGKRRRVRMRRILGRLVPARFSRSREKEDASFYWEALEMLQHRGFRRAPAQTPREFARSLADQPFAWELSELTERHQQIRYGRYTEAGARTQALVLLRMLREKLTEPARTPHKGLSPP